MSQGTIEYRFAAPDGYVAPDWPGLYWPFTTGEKGVYLYYLTEIYTFTLIWTLVFFTSIYGAAGLWAFLMLKKSHPSSYLAPAVFVGVALFSAVIGGSTIGGVLYLVYNAGFFRMSTWVPFLWALIQTISVIMSSYSTVAQIL